MTKALAVLNDETLKKLAATTRQTGLRQNERAVLEAIRGFIAEGSWRPSHMEISRSAGLRGAEALWALRALATRGMVKGDETTEVDRWGYPLKSYWTLTGPDGQPVKTVSEPA